MIEILKRHMVGGQLNEHIAEVEYLGSEGAIKRATRKTMVEWLDKSKLNKAIVRSRENPSHFVYVGAVHPKNSAAYIRTHANGEWTDNLLSLDEY